MINNLIVGDQTEICGAVQPASLPVFCLPQLINNTKYGRMSLISQVRGQPGGERENNSAVFHDSSQVVIVVMKSH